MRSKAKRQVLSLAGKIEKLAEALECDGAVYDYAYEIIGSEEEWFDGLSEKQQEDKAEESDETIYALRNAIDRMEELASEIRELAEELQGTAATPCRLVPGPMSGPDTWPQEPPRQNGATREQRL